VLPIPVTLDVETGGRLPEPIASSIAVQVGPH
jgi:hypothetical protein